VRLFEDRPAQVDKFGRLLFVTGVTVAALSLISAEPRGSGGGAGPAVATVLAGGTLLLALRASGLARRWQRAADVVVGVAVAVNVVLFVLQRVAHSVDAAGISSAGRPLTLVVLSALTPVAVVRRLLKHRRVSAGTLFGAISAYLLIPIAFFYAFLTANALQATPFFGQPEPTTSFMYFSLTTVTTLGYGDLTAATALGRLLATSEAIVGQIYLVTFVAMLVGLLAQHRDTPGADDAT
jgi:hypothetical protein